MPVGAFRRAAAIGLARNQTLPRPPLPFRPEDLTPRTTQRGLNPGDRRQQDVHVSPLDFPDRLRIQRTFLRQFLLRELAYHPGPADVPAGFLELSSLGL